jgi:hypothetical protein
MIIVPKGLGGLLKLVAIDIPAERLATKLESMEKNLQFVRRNKLVNEQDEPEFVEMLVNGASLRDALTEFRIRRRQEAAR